MFQPLCETNKIESLVCSLLSHPCCVRLPQTGAYLLVDMCFHICEHFSQVYITRWMAWLCVRHLDICVLCSRCVCISIDNVCVYMDECVRVCVSTYAVCWRGILIARIFWEVTRKPVTFSSPPLFLPLSYTGFSPGVNVFWRACCPAGRSIRLLSQDPLICK